MVPMWLIVLSWIGLGLGAVSAGLVAYDIAAGYRQTMPIMDAVWPITALYFGPVAVWAYFKLGRPRSVKAATGNPTATRAWQSGSLSASHCGAGCVLGDIAGGWIVFATGWVLFGERLYAEYVLEFALAWIFGIVFQYFSIAPARPELSRRQAVWMAVKADTLSIVAFQVGMYAWMALAAMVFFAHPLPIDGPVFWFMMQIGLVLGFGTTYPVNQWLVRVGIKHAM